MILLTVILLDGKMMLLHSGPMLSILKLSLVPTSSSVSSWLLILVVLLGAGNVTNSTKALDNLLLILL